MRKSTIVVLVILMVGMVAMTLLYNYYMQQFVEESRHAKLLTEEFRADVEPGTVLRLARVRGGPDYVVTDPSQPGLVLFGRPTQAAWKADPTGGLFARRLVLRMFELYVGERPASWAEFRLTRPDGTMLPPFGYRRGEGRTIEPIAPIAPPAAPGPTPPAAPVAPPPANDKPR